jgi:hypothetical protein
LPAALVAYVVVADLCVRAVILPIFGEERAVVLFTDELVADGTFLSFSLELYFEICRPGARWSFKG